MTTTKEDLAEAIADALRNYDAKKRNEKTREELEVELLKSVDGIDPNFWPQDQEVQ